MNKTGEKLRENKKFAKKKIKKIQISDLLQLREKNFFCSSKKNLKKCGPLSSRGLQSLEARTLLQGLQPACLVYELNYIKLTGIINKSI